MLVILVVKVLGYEGKDYIILVIIIEFIYIVILLYDDVVDELYLCCGMFIVNVEFGNVVSVLVGDFIYICLFQLMVGFGKMLIMEILVDVMNVIVEGEVLQLMNCNDFDIIE